MTDLPRRIDPLSWPPSWLALFALAAWIAGRLWPMATWPRAGGALVLVGLALMAAAALTMMRAGATVDPTREPTALVTHGVFRWSRNPIYLADAVILLGLCLIWQPLAALVLVPGFVWAIPPLHPPRGGVAAGPRSRRLCPLGGPHAPLALARPAPLPIPLAPR